ncbi:MAG: NAD(P)/FAD-dependent oxidoreductase [Clostridia bacterium]|nr:NAD(P)/FAD-dependent oxidoreductase [Clostridia bacterium]
MKVAIIGAGLSGLSCALELKRYGIIPTIFERRNAIGDSLDFAGAALRIFNRAYRDPLKYFKKEFGLHIRPSNYVKEVRMHSPHKQTVVKGNLGYLFNRGREAYTLEKQIAAQVDLPIYFNSYISKEEIEGFQSKYDHIVVATGGSDIVRQFRMMTVTFQSVSRIATVIGDFRTDCVNMWLNTEYSNHAFAYTVPIGPKEARLVLLADNICPREMDYNWEKFLESEQIQYRIVETRDLQNMLGLVMPMHNGNIYFVGDSGGCVDDFLGFGMLNSIESGFIAARCIINKRDYNEEMKPFYQHLEKLNEFRKSMNTLENKDMDRLIFLLGLPGIKQFVYNNPFFNIKDYTFIARMFNNLQRAL